MNKSELVDAVAATANLSKSAASKAVDSVLNAITQSLQQGEQVTLIGFGSFAVRERAARTGRDPRSGKSIDIAASKSPVFKAGKALKDAVK